MNEDEEWSWLALLLVQYLSNKELTIEIFYPLHTQTPHKQVFRNRFIPNFLRLPHVRQVCERIAAIFNQ